MKRSKTILTLVLALALACPGSLLAAPSTGLWAGQVTLTAVSEINKPVADLRFDLQLSGLHSRDFLVRTGDDWHFYAETKNPGSDWQTQDVGGWGLGASPLGYDFDETGADVPLAETLFTDSAAARPVTTYYRKSFTVTLPELPPEVDPYTPASYYSALTLSLLCDDGSVVYLNGVEIYRKNLQIALAGFTTKALGSVEFDSGNADPYLHISLPPHLLQEGGNELAVELHQFEGASDPDAYFDAVLAAEVASPEDQSLINLRADGWKVYNRGDLNTLDPSWNSMAWINLPEWFDGQALFGYGEPDISTPADAGVVSRPATTYFRKEFTVADPAAYSHLAVVLFRDDGAVVYLNGVEIQRDNLPEGVVDYDTAPIRLLGSDEESQFVPAMIENDNLLVAGTNVLAVEIHQHPDEIGSSDGGVNPPTPTTADLTMPLLLHVDSGGQVRLLKQVIMMRDKDSGETVLVVNHERIPEFEGVSLVDNASIGRRLSALAYDFPGDTLDCEQVGADQFSCPLVLPADHPTQPFLHRYHPDHDNWDARYENPNNEVPAITREISFEFRAGYPPENPGDVEPKPLGWGKSVVGGGYSEVLTGLYRAPVEVQGTFLLHKLNDVSALED